MIYLITALDAEARPLIEHYRLKRDYTLPYTFYQNERIILLVTQPGSTNALMATSALLGYRIPKENDLLINIGICGAPHEYPVSEALLIHQIIDKERSYYPDILYTHTLREASVSCVESPQDTQGTYPVDMESSAVFRAASKFIPLHRMAFLKIVSDHFEPERVHKEGVIDLLRSHIETLDSLIGSLTAMETPAPLFSENELDRINALKHHFTVSQGAKLEDAFCYFRLKHPKRPLPFSDEEIPSSKRERSERLEHVIKTLVS